ncbi:hypothetical protein [Marinobacterium stanieri]|uniref:hypothetical protein n=1 Tax=Marinobacterium stanieri TaxID=49186 RepID=UPI000255781E|nr:hypothetical protein [Marinobacterium stanieri]
MKLQIAGFFLVLALALGGWFVAHLRGLQNDNLKLSVNQLEQDKKTLATAYQYASDERDRMDRLYSHQKQEVGRVQRNLEQQIEGLKRAQAGACADAAVSAERIKWLQQPVWLDAPASSNSP